MESCQKFSPAFFFFFCFFFLCITFCLNFKWSVGRSLANKQKLVAPFHCKLQSWSHDCIKWSQFLGLISIWTSFDLGIWQQQTAVDVAIVASTNNWTHVMSFFCFFLLVCRHFRLVWIFVVILIFFAFRERFFGFFLFLFWEFRLRFEVKVQLNSN